ncbi:MAG: PQQ-binding-like beta-propeller repeat protein [Bacteroidales bacterium]|nr:PQQ-binding-like beta-propeller repeat protein [Bacteroidales bacterium]
MLIAVLFFSCQNSVQYKTINSTETETISHLEVYQEKIKFINPTFLGNFQRNYYGDSIPNNLKLNWELFLGGGKTRMGKDTLKWDGAGWTGQPLFFMEDSTVYLMQGAYDYHLKKIDVETGKLVWQYKYDDVIKGSGTLWKNESEKDSLELRYMILQGSRKGFNNTIYTKVIPSYRAISLLNGKEAWRLNIWRTRSYSRDVDASAAYIGDTAYIGLENGRFISFLPDARKAKEKSNLTQPMIIDTVELYSSKDIKTHKGNLVTEASPAILGNRVYIASGSGHVYGYNINTKKIDWQFDIGSDIDGSPVVTNDSCLIISIEKQYIDGHGGALKLNPKKTEKEAVEWFFPVPDKNFITWQGGIIGSVAVSDFYQKDSLNQIAAFTSIKGMLYVVKHTEIDTTKTVIDFNLKNTYLTPKEIFSYNIGPSISTPLIIPPRIVVASYSGIYIFEYDKNYNFRLIAKKQGVFEATPFVYNKKIYIASRDGYLYCLGK